MIDGVSAPDSTSDDTQREAEAWALRSLDLRHHPKVPPDSVLSHLRPRPRCDLADDKCKIAHSSGIDASAPGGNVIGARGEPIWLRRSCTARCTPHKCYSAAAKRHQRAAATLLAQSSSDMAGQQPAAKKLLVQEGHCNLSRRKLLGYEMTFVAMRVLLRRCCNQSRASGAGRDKASTGIKTSRT